MKITDFHKVKTLMDESISIENKIKMLEKSDGDDGVLGVTIMGRYHAELAAAVKPAVIQHLSDQLDSKRREMVALGVTL